MSDTEATKWDLPSPGPTPHILEIPHGLAVHTALEKTKCWANVGTFISGLGTIILAATAFVTALKADDLLEKVLHIQNQTDQITSQTSAIREQGEKLQTAIDLLGERLKEIKAAQVVKEATKENGTQTNDPVKIEEILRKIPSAPIARPGGGLYLPIERRDILLDFWLKNPNPDVRQRALIDAMSIGNGK